jgi:hypothetical protein
MHLTPGTAQFTHRVWFRREDASLRTARSSRLPSVEDLVTSGDKRIVRDRTKLRDRLTAILFGQYSVNFIRKLLP